MITIYTKWKHRRYAKLLGVDNKLGGGGKGWKTCSLYLSYGALNNMATNRAAGTENWRYRVLTGSNKTTNVLKKI